MVVWDEEALRMCFREVQDHTRVCSSFHALASNGNGIEEVWK